MYFATCNVASAKKYILSKYPNNNLDDEKFNEAFDLINQDIFRLTDPSMHGSIAVIAGSKYKESEHRKLADTMVKFFDNIDTASELNQKISEAES